MDGIDFYITDAFGEGLYESCKDVKFGTMNTRALEFIGSGAKNFKGELIVLVCIIRLVYACLNLNVCLVGYGRVVCFYWSASRA